MKPRSRLLAVAGAAAGVGAGVAVQHAIIARRRRDDPESGEPFASRRGLRERTITVGDGACIFVTEAGPLSERGALFLHGSALRSDLWHYQMPGIGDHRLVFADLRGHGRSHPRGDSELSISRLAADAAEIVTLCGLSEVVIVGHSIGGMVALRLCLDRPDLMGSVVKGLVLANTTHRPPAETLAGGAAVARLERLVRRPLDLLADHSRRLELLRRVIRPSDWLFLAVSVAAFGPHPSARQVDFTYDMLAETPIDVIFELLKCYRTFDVGNRLGDITVPCLVVAGDHDRLTVPRASEDLAAGLPDARIVVLDRCGHQSMLERHAEFNELLEGFFDEVLGAPRPARAAARG